MEPDTERLRELLRQPIRDNVAARALLEALREPVAKLLEAYEAEAGRDGGAFGRRVLDLVESRVLKELNGRVELSDRVSIISCSVHVGQGATYIDTRLKVDWPL